TYAPVEHLRALYERALTLPGVVGLNIATRADCLPDDVIALLAELSQRTVVTLELGLQTVHDRTAERIRRGHDFDCFVNAWKRMREKAPDVRLGVHLIFGLVGENDEMMVETVQKVAELAPDEVKIHYLYVVDGTEMADMYREKRYFPIEREQYVDLVIRALELLPAQTVVTRLTGDGNAKTLLAPLWGKRKREILNEIDKKIYERNTQQGINCAVAKPFKT
ncbi:MAG: TIGR01212 family radical SAM protein, partial [Clostridia bacterium]|nr:TIGR01212 family radical SAM protein [Clostridia bacterium]